MWKKARSINYMIILIIFLISCSCKHHAPQKTKDILIFINKQQLFLYNTSEEQIKKITDLKIGFSGHTLQALNDSEILLGYPGILKNYAISKKNNDTMTCPCSEENEIIIKGIVGSDDFLQITERTDTIRTINIYNSKIKNYQYWHSLKKKSENNTLIEVINFSNGNTLNHSFLVDSGIEGFPDINKISSVINEKQKTDKCSTVKSSDEGSIYLIAGNSKRLVLKNINPVINCKCRNGYYWPTLSPDEKKIAFVWLLADFRIFGNKTVPADNGLYEINIETNNVRRLVKSNVLCPTYSGSGSFLAYSYYINKMVKDDIQKKIQIIDMKTLNISDIGDGEFYTWIK